MCWLLPSPILQRVHRLRVSIPPRVRYFRRSNRPLDQRRSIVHFPITRSITNSRAWRRRVAGWPGLCGRFIQGFEVTRKYFEFNQCCAGTSPADFAWEKFQKLLHFVQRGRILLRCGSALALSLPSLGVSSLDLGRLFTQAALFSCAMFFAMRFSSATSAEAISTMRRRQTL
jgi:hypothetical protein